MVHHKLVKAPRFEPVFSLAQNSIDSDQEPLLLPLQVVDRMEAWRNLGHTLVVVLDAYRIVLLEDSWCNRLEGFGRKDQI